MKGTITLLFASTGELLSCSAQTLDRISHLDHLSMTSTDDGQVIAFTDLAPYFLSHDVLEITVVVGGGLHVGQISVIESIAGERQFLVQLDDAHHPSVLHVQRMKQILDCAQIATWEWNVQTGETQFSESWAGFVGYSLKELEPTDIQTWSDLVHPDDLILSEQALNAHLSGEQAYYECEVRMRHKSGHWVWVRDYGRVVSWDKQGQPEWVLGAHIDVSIYKYIQAQNELLSKDLNMIMDLCPAVIYKISADQGERVQFITRGVETLLQFKDEEVVNRVNWWRAHIHPEDLSEYDKRVTEWRAQGDNAILDCEYRFRRADGHYIWLADRARIVTSADGRSQYYVGSIIDISELVSLNSHLQSLAKVSPAVLYQFEYLDDGSSRFPYASQKLTEIFGVTPEEAAQDSTPVFNAIYPDDVAKVLKSVEKSVKTMEAWKCEFRVKVGNKLRWLYGHSMPSLSNEGTVVWSGQIIDISEKKELELRLQKESTTDPLTGAYNRRYFLQELQEELLRSSRDKQDLAILAIDFDLFKQINDRFGHDAGDYVLQQVSHNLQQHLREYDTLARMGGEEFTVLLPNTDYQTAFAIADKLRRLVEVHKMRYQQQDILLTVTIGVAATREGFATPFTLLKQADRALYQGKENGRNCVC